MLDSWSPLGNLIPQTLPVALYSFPSRARKIAADDTLDRNDLGPADEHGALVENLGEGVERFGEFLHVGREEVVRADQRDEIEPKLRQLGQDLPLEGNEGGEDPIERGHAVGRDDQEVVADREDVADFPLLEKRNSGKLDVSEGAFHRRTPLIT
jgi:hypothetical protein